VQDAIAKIESRGQEVEVDGDRRRRAELDTLYRRERYLRAMTAREARGGGVRTRRFVPKW
jgi:hypothetical protein